MSARATWKGLLQISLVTVPIKVFPATEFPEGLAFHQLHESCQSRLQQKRWCPTCAREVPTTEIVKGYEFEKGRYVLLQDDELAAVRPPSARVIDLVQFAEVDELDPMYIDRTYYLAPDGADAGEAYGVMRAGMGGRVGIGKLALYGREYLVAVRALPRGGVLLLHTLHYAAGIRDVDAIEDLQAVPPRLDRDQVQLARTVIDALEQRTLNLSDFTDDYRAEVQQLIDAKIAGKEIVVPKVETPAVVNLRDALVKSLQAVSATKRTAAKVAMPAAAAKRKRAS